MGEVEVWVGRGSQGRCNQRVYGIHLRRRCRSGQLLGQARGQAGQRVQARRDEKRAELSARALVSVPLPCAV